MSRQTWKKNLTEAESHLTLYAKAYYYSPEDTLKRDLETVHAINKGGVITKNEGTLTKFAYNTYLKLNGPESLAENLGDMISRAVNAQRSNTFLYSEYKIIEGIVSLIANTKVPDKRPKWLPANRNYPFLENVEAKIIGIDESHRLYPKVTRRWDCPSCGAGGYFDSHENMPRERQLEIVSEQHDSKTINCTGELTISKVEDIKV